MVKQVCCDTMHSIPVLPSHMQKKLLPLSRSCERFRGQTLVAPAQPSPPGLLSPPQGAAGQSPAGIRCGGALSPLGTYGAGRGSNGAGASGCCVGLDGVVVGVRSGRSSAWRRVAAFRGFVDARWRGGPHGQIWRRRPVGWPGLRTARSTRGKGLVLVNVLEVVCVLLDFKKRDNFVNSHGRGQLKTVVLPGYPACRRRWAWWQSW